jgi:curved DNA-binding protein CbpA
MLQPQGPRVFEPYRILQVQPHAAHELIVEAYWTLIARAKSHGNDAAMRALNAAYELLTSSDRRAQYDREHGFVREEPEPYDKKKHKDRKNGSKTPADHYRMLAVDQDADRDVIDIAYRIGMRKAAGHHPELVLLREQLTDAFHTLSSAQLRAQYDGAIGISRAPEPVADAAADGGSAAKPDAVPEFLSSKNEPRGEEPAVEKKRGVFGLFGKREKQAAEPSKPAKAPQRAKTAAAVPPKVADETARGDRLMELRPFGAEVLVGAMRRGPTPEAPPMAVLTVVGPQGEERVPLPPRTITIGSSDEMDIILPGKRVAPEQGRMWPHGDSFALRLTGRGFVRVSGVVPTLAVVLLEDGDVIEMGEYRLTFHNAPRE